MWITDLFKKRKPNHLIVYYLYKKEESRLYKFLSKFTYSVGPFNNIDETIDGIRKFIKEYPDKLDQINITSYGTGRYLIQTSEPERIKQVVDSLKPIMHENTKLMFTTCYSGVSNRNLIDMSEHLNGMEVSGMYGNYSLNGKMKLCSCKKEGYNKELLEKLKLSKNGLKHDEKMIVDIIRRDEKEIIDWKSCGMAYEYNKISEEDGICRMGDQPYTLLKCIRNYLFNIQD
jgi:hypothetical protein